MDSDDQADPNTDEGDFDDDYEVVEAWAANGTGLAFDGRVVEYFPSGGPSVRMHIRNLQAEVREEPGGSAEIILDDPGARHSFSVADEDLPVFKDVVGTINATSEVVDPEPGLDHW
jgi:hypothetical protein